MYLEAMKEMFGEEEKGEGREKGRGREGEREAAAQRTNDKLERNACNLKYKRKTEVYIGLITTMALEMSIP